MSDYEPAALRAGDERGAVARSRPVDLNSFSGDPNFMLSLARGLKVMQALAAQRRSLTVSECAAVTGLPRATVRRCFYTLEKLGFVQASGPAFALGAPVLALGEAYLAAIGPSGAIQAIMDKLRDTLDETCVLARLDGQDLVYLAMSRGRNKQSIPGQPGSHVPAFCTSLGRVLLANLPPAGLEAVLANIQPVKFTPFTITDADTIRTVIAHARAAGYSINDQELDLGVRALSVPVRDRTGKVVAALNAGGDPSRLKNGLLLSKFLPEMNMAAQEIGKLIDQL
jgi:IclR family pca regulon transcriptional regulator